MEGGEEEGEIDGEASAVSGVEENPATGRRSRGSREGWMPPEGTTVEKIVLYRRQRGRRSMGDDSI